MSRSLYQQQLLNRYRSCTFKRELPGANVQMKVDNPTCGDTITLSLCIADGIITESAYQGVGCVISQVAASLLCERIIGADLTTACAISAQDMQSLLALSLGPTRLKCAILALEALHKSIVQYQENKTEHAQSNSSHCRAHQSS